MANHNVVLNTPLLSTPMKLPLRLRVEGGRYGSRRSQPIGSDDRLADFGRAHDGVDLLCDDDDKCVVWPIISGLVVDTRLEGGDGKVTILHHLPGGPGYLSRYLHLQTVDVEIGEFVEVGTSLGTVGIPDSEKDNKDWPKHLHLTLRHIVANDLSTIADINDACSIGAQVTKDSRSIPLDPTRALYRWELELYDNDEDRSATSKQFIKEVSEITRNRLHFFRVRLEKEDGGYLIPLYELSADELIMIELLKNAFFHDRKVELSYRRSYFWNKSRVISQVIVHR